MIHVYSKMVSLCLAFLVVLLMGLSWDWLTERPRHARLPSWRKSR